MYGRSCVCVRRCFMSDVFSVAEYEHWEHLNGLSFVWHRICNKLWHDWLKSLLNFHVNVSLYLSLPKNSINSTIIIEYKFSKFWIKIIKTWPTSWFFNLCGAHVTKGQWLQVEGSLIGVPLMSIRCWEAKCLIRLLRWL